MSESEFLQHEECPSCGSSDALARYDDGHAYCFAFGCKHREKGDDDAPPTPKKSVSAKLIPTGEPWQGRGISRETCGKLGYTVGDYHGQKAHVVNIPDQQGNIVAQKVRLKDKQFRFLGDAKQAGLVFQDKWAAGSAKKIVVTEGEIDALSVSQAQGNRYPVVSLPNGVDSATKVCARARDYLNSFPEVIFMFDMDKPGKAAAESCAQMFGMRAKIAELPTKDANELLQEGRAKEIVSAVFNAQAFSPDGIVSLSSLREEMKKETERGRPWIFDTMTRLTFGRRPGELYFFGAGSGIGKTDFFLQQITDDICSGYKVAMFLLEQPVVETGKRIAGKYSGHRFHLPPEDGGWTEEELDEAVTGITSHSEIFLYDHFGSKDWDTIAENIRWLNITEGVTDFYVDHLTALTAHADDERREIERITAEMSGICQELNINLYVVSHLATPDGTPHEEGGRVMAKHFKGSRAIIYWAHFMFGFERNTQAEDLEERHRTTVRFVKDRFTGQATGETFYLGYHSQTGRLYESDYDPSEESAGSKFAKEPHSDF